jgi:hypothetical protein
MNKIVILTSEPEPDYALIALLNMVFPDCEIRVVSSINGGLIEVTLGPSAQQRLTSQKGK